MAEQAGIVRAAVAGHGGHVVDTQGDSFFAAFRSAREAVAAAAHAQRELAAADWPDGVQMRVRMGLHSGEPKAGEERYVGMGVHRAARIGAAAHGGQVLASESARVLAVDDLPQGVALRDLGVHRLKDIDEPVRLYQVTAQGLQERFPAPRTLRTGRNRRARVRLAVAALAIGGGAAAGAVLATGSSLPKPVRLVANSIAVIDPKSGKPVGDVPLGFAPTNVVASGEQVWVLNKPARTAVAIDAATLHVVQTVGLDGDPTMQFAADGTDWVALPGSVDEIETSGVQKIPLWKPSRPPGGAAFLRNDVFCRPFVTGDARDVWVSEGRHVAEFSIPTGTLLHRWTLPAASTTRSQPTCYGVRYASDSLFAVRDPDESVGRLNTRTGEFLPIVSAAGLTTNPLYDEAVTPWTAGFGRLWVSTTTTVAQTGAQRGTLTSFDLGSGQQASTTTLGSAAGAPVVDPAGVWLVDLDDEALVHVDASTGAISGKTRLHHFPCCSPSTLDTGVAVGHGRIWVALQSP